MPGLFHSSIVGSSLGGGYRSGKVSGGGGRDRHDQQHIQAVADAGT